MALTAIDLNTEPTEISGASGANNLIELQGKYAGRIYVGGSAPTNKNDYMSIRPGEKLNVRLGNSEKLYAWMKKGTGRLIHNG